MDVCAAMNITDFTHKKSASKFYLKGIIYLFILIFSLLILVSCGGGSDDENIDAGNNIDDNNATTITGQFIDEPVQGLNYNCSSGTLGVTNSNGEYTCNTGDNVTFFLGSISIGTVVVQSVISPYLLFENDIDAAINLARLLQSIDSDGDINNSVTVIDDSLIALLPANTDFSSPAFAADTEAALNITLVSSEVARARLNDTVIQYGGVIPVTDNLPVANAGSDQTVQSGSSVSLNGSASYGPQDHALIYSWTFLSRPASSNASLSDATIVNPVFNADTRGVFIIQLVVNDGVNSSNIDSVVITVNENTNISNEAPARQWLATTGTSDNDLARDIDVDSNGNVYITGYSNSNFEDKTNNGSSDLFISKYDANGNRQWTVLNGTDQRENAEAIAVDKQRNVLYVTGFTDGNLDGELNNGDRDIYITKYDTDGNHLWTVLNGTTGKDRGYAIAVDVDGDVYVTGRADLSLNGNAGAGGYDLFISKYNADGDRLWTQQTGTNSFEAGYGIALDPDKNVYVVGYSGSGLDGNESAGATDIIVTKYNTDGVRQWTQQQGTASVEAGHDIAVDENGNVYITGHTQGDLADNNQGGWDFIVAKYDTNGVLQWTQQSGTDGIEWGWGIALDSELNIYVTGITEGSLDGNASQGEMDYFIAKYNNDGEYIWSLQDGTRSTEWSESLVIDSVDNIYTSGIFYGAIIPNNGSKEDVFVAKYGNNIISSEFYTVGGTVDGIIGSFTLTNNNGDEITIEENGSFTFPTGLPDGASYDVKISTYINTGFRCFVSGGDNDDGTGAIPGANVTSIQISCYGV